MMPAPTPPVNRYPFTLYLASTNWPLVQQVARGLVEGDPSAPWPGIPCGTHRAGQMQLTQAQRDAIAGLRLPGLWFLLQGAGGMVLDDSGPVSGPRVTFTQWLASRGLAVETRR